MKKAVNSKDIVSHAKALAEHAQYVDSLNSVKDKTFEELTAEDKDLLLRILAERNGLIKR